MLMGESPPPLDDVVIFTDSAPTFIRNSKPPNQLAIPNPTSTTPLFPAGDVATLAQVISSCASLRWTTR